MFRLKDGLIIALLILSPLLWGGCGLPFSQQADPGLESFKQGDELPEWLLLTHRSNESSASEREKDLADQQDLAGEDRIDLSGEAGLVEEPAISEPQVLTDQPEEASSEPEQKDAGNDQLKPGTMEWILEQKRKEEELRKARQEALAEDEDQDDGAEAEIEKEWWDLNKNNGSDFQHESTMTIN